MARIEEVVQQLPKEVLWAIVQEGDDALVADGDLQQNSDGHYSVPEGAPDRDRLLKVATAANVHRRSAELECKIVYLKPHT